MHISTSRLVPDQVREVSDQQTRAREWKKSRERGKGQREEEDEEDEEDEEEEEEEEEDEEMRKMGRMRKRTERREGGGFLVNSRDVAGQPRKTC